MSVQVAPPSVARGVGAKHTQRYEALKRELEEFCAKGPQVRNLDCSSRAAAADAPCRRVAMSRALARELASTRAQHAHFIAARPVSPSRARTLRYDFRWRLFPRPAFPRRDVKGQPIYPIRFSRQTTLTSATFLRSIRSTTRRRLCTTPRRKAT